MTEGDVIKLRNIQFTIRKAPNYLIWEAWTRQCLAFLLKKWIDESIIKTDANYFSFLLTNKLIVEALMAFVMIAWIHAAFTNQQNDCLLDGCAVWPNDTTRLYCRVSFMCNIYEKQHWLAARQMRSWCQKKSYLLGDGWHFWR